MANFAYVEGGVIVELLDFLPKSWRNISGLNLAEGNEVKLNSLGWYTIQKSPATLVGTQFIADYTYEFSGGVVIGTPVISDLPPDWEATQLLERRNNMIITPYQAKVVLSRYGLLSSVEAMMSAPEVDIEVKLAWTDAITFKRLDTNIITMGAALGLTDAQLDAMFELGATIGV